MYRLRTCISLVAILILLSSCAVPSMRTLNIDKDIMTSPEEGYLLLGLTTDWAITSIDINGTKAFNIQTFNKFENRNYVLAPLPIGRYEIIKINLPGRRYFEFDNDELAFEFVVKPNAINYVGELRVKKNSQNRALFEMINRSSIALEYLDENFPKLLLSRELVYQGPGIDTFFELVRKDRVVNSVESSNE
jgi:hypothetical protein